MAQEIAQRTIELEIRLTHLEDTMDILNQTIFKQHKEISVLQLQIAHLEKRLKLKEASLIAKESEETPPPHY